jgi:hypothetical protein
MLIFTKTNLIINIKFKNMKTFTLVLVAILTINAVCFSLLNPELAMSLVNTSVDFTVTNFDKVVNLF